MFLNDLNQILVLDAFGYKVFVSVPTDFWRLECQGGFLLSINNSYMHISLEVFIKAMRCVSKKTLSWCHTCHTTFTRDIARMGNTLGK